MINILVPVGTSPNAHETLQYAVDFAAQFNARVYAMEVFSVTAGAGKLVNISEKVKVKSEERLKEIIGMVDAKGVEIKIATFNGDLVDGLKEVDNELGIDLIIVAPRSNDIKEGLYLGHCSGRIVKRTDIPTLIVPKGSAFSPFKNILTAFRSGILKRNEILDPLRTIVKKFESRVNLLMVKTPGYTEEDLQINTNLMDLSSQLTLTENATTYLGIMEHIQAKQPDLLCVFRRKRGIFTNLWEKNTIPKAEFSARIPVLVLSVKKD